MTKQVARSLSDFPDYLALVGMISSKADASHTHLWEDITDKPTEFPPSVHTHLWEDITDKPTAFVPVEHRHNWGDLDGVPSLLESSAIGDSVQPYNANTTTLGNDVTGTGQLVRNLAPAFSSIAITTPTGGFISFDAQSSDPSAPSGGLRLYANSAGGLSWRRASDGFIRSFNSVYTANRVITLPDANTTIPICSQLLTFSGPTAARTITLPDANFTAARTDAAQTFTGNQTFSGNILAAQGTVTAGSLTFGGGTGGIGGTGGDVYFFSSGQRAVFLFTGFLFQHSGGRFGWTSSSTDAAGTRDTWLTRESAGVIQFGDDAAGVTDYTLKGADRITTDGAGANVTIAGGRNRGAANGGSIIFQTSPQAGAGVTGTLRTVAQFNAAGHFILPTLPTSASGLATGTLWNDAGTLKVA